LRLTRQCYKRDVPLPSGSPPVDNTSCICSEIMIGPALIAESVVEQPRTGGRARCLCAAVLALIMCGVLNCNDEPKCTGLFGRAPAPQKRLRLWLL
jgi:hypothetical protein